jgi:mannosyl-3-phosphoglycerate phosphatase
MADRVLIVSDMDGTLLNHHDYEYAAVIPRLAELQKMRIPVILNTSKTFAELESWIKVLAIKHPFIAENGSAIFIPQGYFSDAVLDGEILDSASFPGYQVIMLGESIQRLQAFVDAQPVAAIDFSRCSVEQAMQLTGLTRQQAIQAQTRQFSLPLSFTDEAEQQQFSQTALNAGYSVLRGGRFLHLLGDTDKGRATQRLQQLYQAADSARYTVIALGDSPNDLDMLLHSDIPVVVKSPSSERLNPSMQQLIRTRQAAPEGWVEGVDAALKLIQAKIQQEKSYG